MEKYLSLSMEDGTAVLQDICLKPGRMRIGDKRLCLHTLSDTEDLPGKLSTDMRYERMSTDRSDCRLSFAAPVGLLLSCNHIYSQYVFIDNAQEILADDGEELAQHALSVTVQPEQCREPGMDGDVSGRGAYQGSASRQMPLQCHRLGGGCGGVPPYQERHGQPACMMECTPRYNTVDTPVLYWAGIPGNAGDFPAEESFYTFLEQAAPLCRGDQLQKFSQSVRHPHGGPAKTAFRCTWTFPIFR